jgi:hypothetical protein
MSAAAPSDPAVACRHPGRKLAAGSRGRVDRQQVYTMVAKDEASQAAVIQNQHMRQSAVPFPTTACMQAGRQAGGQAGRQAGRHWQGPLLVGAFHHNVPIQPSLWHGLWRCA